MSSTGACSCPVPENVDDNNSTSLKYRKNDLENTGKHKMKLISVISDEQERDLIDTMETGKLKLTVALFSLIAAVAMNTEHVKL